MSYGSYAIEYIFMPWNGLKIDYNRNNKDYKGGIDGICTKWYIHIDTILPFGKMSWVIIVTIQRKSRE